MTELKTLKDFECLNKIHNHKTRGDFCIIRKSDLKAEAIKWVKEIQKDKTIGINPNPNYKKKGDPIGTCVYGTEERKLINKEKIDFIKHFFNLTEDDLK